MSKFGKRIKNARNDANLTLQEVATRLGLKVSYVSDVEHGRKKPFSPQILSLFALITSCNYLELQALAAQERDSIEISLKSKDQRLNDLAYALARSADSGDTTEIKEFLKLFGED